MDGVGYTGLAITPYFDSMIVKYTTRGSSFSEAVARMKRVLIECRIRGVKVSLICSFLSENISFFSLDFTN